MHDPDNKYPIPPSFYRAFEDRFRGSQEIIFHRLEVYVPFLRLISAEQGQAKGLDLGCGRGEWLRLLEREGIEAKGVDLDQGMLDAARGLGLTVEYKDALQALSETPDGSLALVTGFHIIEHLPFGVVLALMKEARRVLRPGGLLILETPNPENILVGTWSFHLDPTHVKPIPPILMPFLAEYVGFNQATILRVNGGEPVNGVSLSDVFTKVPLDFSLVARTDGSTSSEMDQLFGAHVGSDIFKALNEFDIKANSRWSVIENQMSEMSAQMASERIDLHSALATLRGQIEILKDRSVAQMLFFRPSGRPVNMLLRLAFHKSGRPRGGLLGRIVTKKNGQSRKSFGRWLASDEYASLPWPSQKAGRTSEPTPTHTGSAQQQPRFRLNLIGPNPEEHPRRYAIWGRLSKATHAARRRL